MASTPTSQRRHLFLDFDGTITVRDTGDDVFRTFGQFEPVHSELLAGAMSVADYYQRSAAMLREDLTMEELRAWAVERDVDPGLAGLVSMCQDNDVNVVVTSDGFNAYIQPILNHVGLGDLPIHANELTRNEGTWTCSFPGATESCSCFCASCKRNAVLQHVGEDDVVIYVGDGRSDTCAVQHADVIFAKSHLARWCTEHRVPHHPFKSLHDVRRVLASKLSEGKMKQRRQAVLARSGAFLAE